MKTDPMTRTLDETCYRLTREVRENPLLCVGLALGVGVVIGALSSRAVTSSRPGTSRWLTDLASGLSDEADSLRGEVTRVGRRAGKGMHAALHHAGDAVPEIDVDQLVRRGRRWLRAVLR